MPSTKNNQLKHKETDFQLKLRELDLEEQRLIFGGQRFSQSLDLAKHVVSAVAWTVSVGIFMYGLVSLGDKPAGSLNGIAQIFKEMNMAAWIGYVAAALFGAGWYIERKGKKRAIREKGKYQLRAEGGEPSRSSSHLSPEGDTPKEE